MGRMSTQIFGRGFLYFKLFIRGGRPVCGVTIPAFYIAFKNLKYNLNFICIKMYTVEISNLCQNRIESNNPYESNPN